jgi:hypothetical protein
MIAIGWEKKLAVYYLLIISLCVTFLVTTGHAETAAVQGEKKQEASETNGDAKPKGKWLPIPIPLTEPAFGYGLGVAVAYFHPTKKERETLGTPNVHSLDSTTAGRSGQKTPPTVTGVAGGYTNQDTWAVAFAHANNWRNDTIRYVGGLAYADVKSSYYILNQPFDFTVKGGALYQDVRFRLGESRWFLGGKLRFMDTEAKFNNDLDKIGTIGLDDIQSRDMGVAGEATYDSRDNVFTPNSGQLLQFDVWRFDEALTGDFNYWRGGVKLLSFHQLHKKFVMGLRLEMESVDGRAPFYAYPYVKLRGIPALRYQGKRAGSIEVEGRWNILPRWAILGFFGSGAAKIGSFSDSDLSIVRDDLFAGGVGGRYFMMQDHGLWLGVDLAHGPEDLYVYITVGQAW